MARWDARETFSIDPKDTQPFTCVGIAKSENRRCHKAIGKQKRIAAAKLMNELSALSISGKGYNERRLKEKIKELLDEVLCCIHKDGGCHPQIETVEREWWGKVQMAQAAMRNDGGRRPAQVIQRGREYRPVADVEPAAADWTRQALEPVPMGIADQNQVLRGRIARDEAEREELIMIRAEERRRLYERRREEQRRAREREALEASMRRREEEERQREVERIYWERELEANRIRGDREEMLRMDREFAIRLAREEVEEELVIRQEEAEAEAQEQRAARRALRRNENRRHAQVPYLPEIPELFQPRPVQRRVQRKPLGDCYSCLEPINRSEDADWCRAECGQNICNGCLQEWMRNQVGRELRCGVCRSIWKLEDA
ncbi:hypothetical protein EAE96_004133 [Botrytis aclada]|nr:hypothetical protein EAE96_004133 [Botrytis aclada]